MENYHKIVKQPMDFGTMRAKLYEGMYSNLNQFKVRKSSDLTLSFLELLLSYIHLIFHLIFFLISLFGSHHIINLSPLLLFSFFIFFLYHSPHTQKKNGVYAHRFSYLIIYEHSYIINTVMY